MKLKLLFVPVLLQLILVGCSVSYNESEEVEPADYTAQEKEEAMDALKLFLAKYDEDPGETYEVLSPIIRDSTPKLAWIAAVKTIKLASGDLVRRGKGTMFCTEELPGGPKGKYFVYDLSSHYSKGKFTERIVISKENQSYKVAGYFVTKSFKD